MGHRRHGNLFSCFWQVPNHHNWDHGTIGITVAGVVLALVKVTMGGLVQPLRLWDEASMGTAWVLAQRGSDLCALCGCQMHCAGVVVPTAGPSQKTVPGPTSQKIVLCFVVFVAVSNWHRRAYVMACDCCH